MSISASEVAAMRSTAAVYLSDTCTIKREVETQDDQGGTVLTYSDFATGVACRMDEPITSGPEQAINMEVATAVKSIMHFLYSQDVTVKDRIVYSGITYEVQEALDAATWLITRRLVVTRLR